MQRIHERALKVVENFKHSLNEATRQKIGSANFEELSLMIQQAIQDDRKEAADLVEKSVKTLRKDIEVPDLGL